MKSKAILSGSALTAALMFAASAHATVITFDDLASDGPLTTYAGVNWNSEWFAYSEAEPPYTPESAPYRVFDLASPGSFNFSAPVVFDGAYFSGYSYATVQFQLLLGGSVVATSGTLAPSDAPAFLASGYNGLVDQVNVLSPEPDFFVMDNVTYNAAIPEPATWAMMLVGFGGLGAAMRSRRKLVAATAA